MHQHNFQRVVEHWGIKNTIVLWITITVKNVGSLVIEPNLAFFDIVQYQHCVCPEVCIHFELNLICHYRWTSEQTCIGRSKTNTPSLLGLLLVFWASSGSIHPIESTPNKVSQQRARSSAERRASRSNFTWSQPKHSLVHLSFLWQFPMHHINESQLFLCFTIRKFIFGQRSVA